MRSTAFAIASCAAACAPRLEDHELGEQSRLLFRDFDLDPVALVAEIERMDELLGGVDLDGKQKKRQFAMPLLTEEFWGGAPVPAGLDPGLQFPVGMAALSTHSVDENVFAQTQEDQVCINANSVKCHLREFLTDVECFRDRSCDNLRTRNVIRIEVMVVNFWIEAFVDFRWVELTDGRAAVVSRAWIEESFESDKEESYWDQRFAVDVFIPDPDQVSRTRRWYGTWLAGDVGGVSDATTKQVITDSMEEGFTNPDEFLDGEDCKIDSSECEFPTF